MRETPFPERISRLEEWSRSQSCPHARSKATELSPPRDIGFAGACKEARPLAGVEIARVTARAEAEGGRESLDLQRREHGSQSPANRRVRREGILQEPPVRLVQVQRDACARTTLKTKHSGIDTGRRSERGAVEATGDRNVELRSPVGRTKRRRPHCCVLRRELPLNDHECRLQRDARVAKEAGQNFA